jgi:hypothetical protein
MLNILPSVFFIMFGANIEMAQMSHGDLKMELTDLSYDLSESLDGMSVDDEVISMSQKSIDILAELKRRNKLKAEDESMIVSIDSKIRTKDLSKDDLNNLLNTVNTYTFHRAKSR